MNQEWSQEMATSPTQPRIMFHSQLQLSSLESAWRPLLGRKNAHGAHWPVLEGGGSGTSGE